MYQKSFGGQGMSWRLAWASDARLRAAVQADFLGRSSRGCGEAERCGHQDPVLTRPACAQDEAYRNSVLPPDVTARVSIEAGTTFGWSKYVGTSGKMIGVDHFGASAPAPILYKKYGITKDAVVEAANALC